MASWIGTLFLALAIGAGITFRFILARRWNGPQERSLFWRRAILWWVISIVLVAIARFFLIRYYQSAFGQLVQ